MKMMNLKLSENQFSQLTQMYGEQIAALEGSIWHIVLNCCGCSGDCGSNWQQS